MAEFTFLEVHLRDANLHAGRTDKSDAATADQPAPEADGSRTGTVLAALVGVVFLAVVAYAVRKAFGGDGASDAANGNEI